MSWLRRFGLFAILFAGLTLLADAGQAQDAGKSPILIEVTLPESAVLTVDGVPVKQTGGVRGLITPALPAGKTYSYALKAVFSQNGKQVVVEKTITVESGKVSKVDLTSGATVVQEEPKKAMPKEEPKKEVAKKKEVVVKEEPKKAMPKEEPKVEAKKELPRIEVPRKMPKDEPKKELPKIEEPKKEMPKKELPKIEEPKKEVVKKDPTKKTIVVPYVTTPKEIVKAMLKLADVKKDDIVYDLGSGDGRITIAAVKDFKAIRGYGIDLDAERVKESQANARMQGVEKSVEFKQGDVLDMKDVRDATVVTLYMLPQVNQKLAPMLKKSLKPGARVVSHDFDMGLDWKPTKVAEVRDEDGTDHKIYLWVIPEKK